MKERTAIILGLRSPFCKANGLFRKISVDDLGAPILRELLARSPIKPEEVDEFISGTVVEAADATNVARIIAIKGGLPIKTPAFTVGRNCASGLQAIVSGHLQIEGGHSTIIIAGGAESMSQFPITFPPSMRDFLLRFSKKKGTFEKIKALFGLRPKFFKPHVPEIRDPLCSLSMGETAEKIARELSVSRKEADLFAHESQRRAAIAQKNGFFAEEILPYPLFERDKSFFQKTDDGIRLDQTLEALEKLSPVFEKGTGIVTAGNSSQVTDGACFVVLMSESEAKKRHLKPMGYIRAFSEAALDPSRMGLGPVFAITKLLLKEKLSLEDIDLIEINEAFASQVVACQKALASSDFCTKELGLSGPVGKIDPAKLNIHGGAVALGHPVGASGARLVLTLLHSLNQENKRRGIASLCIGGGQGQAICLETT